MTGNNCFALSPWWSLVVCGGGYKSNVFHSDIFPILTTVELLATHWISYSCLASVAAVQLPWNLTGSQRTSIVFFFIHFFIAKSVDWSHDDVIKWKRFPRYWPFVRGNPRSPVNSPHKGQWPEALMFSLICALNKRLSKQSWGWWFQTPSCSLWCNCNVIFELRGLAVWHLYFWQWCHHLPFVCRSTFLANHL